jgi:serine/threonine-protein kinase
VAKAVSEATGRHSLTTAGIALGTPAYMAPEQAAADPHTDHRVDIYAFGVMAYEMLTGRPPFVAPTTQEVLAAHVTRAPEPIGALRPSCPPLLAQTIMRCLEKKASDRPQSTEELLPILETVATPSAGTTPTSTRPIPAVERNRRIWRWLPALAVVMLLAALGIVVFRGKTNRRSPWAARAGSPPHPGWRPIRSSRPMAVSLPIPQGPTFSRTSSCGN